MEALLSIGAVQLIFLILGVMLALSPLFIWSWTKANNQELRKQTAILEGLAKKFDAPIPEQTTKAKQRLEPQPPPFSKNPPPNS
jgi:predicted negative regulator of RcsB-dependent stress response